MALTFTSWDLCDDPDNPTLDWSSPAAIQGRLPRRYFEALRSAITERRAARNLSVSGLNQEFVQGTSIGTKINALETAMGDLWSNSAVHGNTVYLNPATQVGGNWHALAATDLTSYRWTEATLLAALGDPARISPYHRLWTWQEWLYQVKRMLSLLTTTYHRLNITPPIVESKNVQSGGEKTWAELTTEFESTAWSYDGAWTGSWSYIMWTYGDRGNRPYRPYRQTMACSRAKARLSALYTGAACTLDWYVPIGHTVLGSSGTSPDVFTYDNFGQSQLVQSLLSLWQEGDGPAQTATRDSDWTNDRATPADPGVPAHDEIWKRGFEMRGNYEPHAVAHWDVPGGFTFQ